MDSGLIKTSNRKVSFKGNTSLRPPGLKIAWSKQLVEQVIKCKDNPEEFFNYCMITTLDHGKVPFKLFDYQKTFVNAVMNNRFVIGMMSRQNGKSEVVAGLALMSVIFNSSYTVAILANKLSAARETFSRVQEMFEDLPDFLKIGVKKWNRTSFELENGSEVFCAPTSKSSIRGRTINLLIIDEFAFVQNDVEFFTASYPVISSGQTSKIVIISTPNGNNMFKHLYDQAVSKQNAFVPCVAYWWDRPGRDQAWKDTTISNIGLEAFKTEYELNFAGSAGTLIFGEVLSSLKPATPEKIINETLMIFKNPIQDHLYLITADVSEGVGKDASTFIVFDITKWWSSRELEIVATFEDNKIDLDRFRSIIASVGRHYNEALFANENNSIGRSLGFDLINVDGYDYVIRTRVDKGQLKIGGKGSIPGVRTTKPIKRIGCSNLKRAIETGRLQPKDRRVIAQLDNFLIKEDGKYEAAPGHHDDLVTPLWLCMFLLSTSALKSTASSFIDTEDLTEDEALNTIDSDESQCDFD